jgi:hypothetical protein
MHVQFDASSSPLSTGENHSSLSGFYQKLFEKYPRAFFSEWALVIQQLNRHELPYYTPAFDTWVADGYTLPSSSPTTVLRTWIEHTVSLTLSKQI